MDLLRRAQIYFRIATMLEGRREEQEDREILGSLLVVITPPSPLGKLLPECKDQSGSQAGPVLLYA